MIKGKAVLEVCDAYALPREEVERLASDMLEIWLEAANKEGESTHSYFIAQDHIYDRIQESSNPKVLFMLYSQMLARGAE